MLLKDWITLAIGCFGAVLGIVNLTRDLIKTRRQERARLQVNVKFGILDGANLLSSSTNVPSADSFLVVEIVNHSLFPVYIGEISLQRRSRKRNPPAVLYRPMVLPQREWPVKLDRNESVTVLANKLHATDVAKLCARVVCVQLTTGQTFQSGSRILRHAFREHAGGGR